MSTKKKIIISIISVFIVLTAILAVYYIVNYNSAQSIKEDVGAVKKTLKPGESLSVIGEIRTTDTDEEIDLAMALALKDDVYVMKSSVVRVMHDMTHQKVVASDKWNSIQMTPERIEQIIKVIETKGTDWDLYENMLKIAKKWQAGDFSEIDKDHNYFWKLENGNIGKAKGIMTPEEEAAFVEKIWGTETK